MIDRSAFARYLTQAFSENGLTALLDADKVRAFAELTDRLLGENEKYNLTAIRDPEKIALLHYADSVTLSAYLASGATVLDVGCGAGFPTLPLAIVRPDLRIVCVDSTEKKVRYVRETAALLGLSRVDARVMRAEEGGRDPALRERFDFVTARAVAELRVLAELTLPFVRVGGSLLAMKGKQVADEVAAAAGALSALGGCVAVTDQTPLRSAALGEQSHAIVRVEKVRHTPAAYPRPFAQITKKPL